MAHTAFFQREDKTATFESSLTFTREWIHDAPLARNMVYAWTNSVNGDTKKEKQLRLQASQVESSRVVRKVRAPIDQRSAISIGWHPSGFVEMDSGAVRTEDGHGPRASMPASEEHVGVASLLRLEVRTTGTVAQSKLNDGRLRSISSSETVEATSPMVAAAAFGQRRTADPSDAVDVDVDVDVNGPRSAGAVAFRRPSTSTVKKERGRLVTRSGSIDFGSGTDNGGLPGTSTSSQTILSVLVCPCLSLSVHMAAL
ncbi:hypothetical protein EG329_010672 [Mollisiaceae sp. DMI_Dod_QoI]|nr:hypothetical protein EG329_010672 [Helotiales sp. DMI_Dod_QoI]